jgi:hypothetical protein
MNPKEAARLGWPREVLAAERAAELALRTLARAGAGDPHGAMRLLGDFEMTCPDCGTIRPFRAGFPIRAARGLWAVEVWCRRCRRTGTAAALICDDQPCTCGSPLFWQDTGGEFRCCGCEGPVDPRTLVRFLVCQPGTPEPPEEGVAWT